LLARGVMSLIASQDSNSAQVDRLVSHQSRQTSRREILSMGRWKHISEKGLENVLFSALLAADKDLRQVVDEVENLSKTLKSDLADKHPARVALHPAVWGAVRQTLLDRELRYLALTDGDEFVVLALEASSENHQAILLRMERSLKKLDTQESRYDLSLSVGVARFDPKKPVSLGELMVRADRDMHEQKRKKQKT
jgi:Diguanylate cyclase, GGDEF domain